MDLKEHGVNRGQFIGYCLDNLKLAWIESDFTLEKDQLLSETLNKVVDNYQEPAKRKKKWYVFKVNKCWNGPFLHALS